MVDYTYEVERIGTDTIIRINAETIPHVPSIEDSEITMEKAVDTLMEVGNATKIVFHQKRDYEYDFAQVIILQEIAKLYDGLVRKKEIFSFKTLKFGKGNAESRYNNIQDIIFNTLRKDPIGSYVKLHRLIRRERILFEKLVDKEQVKSQQQYIEVLNSLEEQLKKTKIISIARPHLEGYKVGDRGIYKLIFQPTIKPDFMHTKLMADFPKDSEEVDTYKVGETTVVIFKLKDSIQFLYHINPPEFQLEEDEYEILDGAKTVLSEHQPEESDFVNPERMREVFFNVGKDLIEELANYKNIKLTEKKQKTLTEILVRYTVGFGLIEILMKDEKVQDVTINSPVGQSPMFLVHQDYDECKTNILPTITESESWATKLRLLSGRPLDEANPILDTEINIPGVANSRVGVISKPLNPTGLAFAFRRHRDKPWTLPLFIKYKMLNPLAAGIISFIIDGNRTLLVAGTRSAGKSSLLGSLLVEIMRKYRIITIEDTLELPVRQLRDLNYNIQHMKVASALTKGTTEVPADEGIRTTLRMGDSALIVGEVRSTEAKALYEAMRVGALANVVAGTIHGDSPYGVFDRVVNDLEVPKTSFKATDIIIVANPIKSGDGLHRWRRVTQITEVRKKWEEDPLSENGFINLMMYDSKDDELKPTPDLMNGESEILKSIAGNVKEWAGNWDALWDNILLRAKVKQHIVNVSDKEKDSEMLEAEFVVQANDQFHRLSDSVKEKTGFLDSEKIFFEWKEWLKREVKKRKQK